MQTRASPVIVIMAGTFARDMRDMPTLCIPSHEFGKQMDRIFSANRNRHGAYVYNHAGAEVRIGDANKSVLFADVKHNMNLPDYIPSKTARSFLKVEVVNEDAHVEVSATIQEGLNRFIPPGDFRDLITTMAANPNGPDVSHDTIFRDRFLNQWRVNAIRRQGMAPYIVINVTTLHKLEELMNSIFDLDPNYHLADPMSSELQRVRLSTSRPRE